MKKDKKIEKMIHEGLREEQPSADFKNKIMDQIEALDAKEESALRSLLQKNMLETPSLNFGSRVMLEIGKTSRVVNTPIIGKRAWIFIVFAFTALTLFSIFRTSGNSAASVMINESMAKVDKLFSFELPGILSSPVFAMSVFALSSLLFLDYVIRNRRLSVKL